MMVNSCVCRIILLYFFFNDTATTEIYTLSLHDALPICCTGGVKVERRRSAGYQYEVSRAHGRRNEGRVLWGQVDEGVAELDRKSTRLNSSHANISYAVFCLKKK